jgi:hypothetical protein
MNEITTIEKQSSALMTVETLLPEKAFAPGGIKSIVAALKTEVRAQAAALDISTEKDRKQIASLAYKVAQSKTALDKMGKDLTADWQRQTNLVNEDRRYLRDDLDALKDEVRKPLDDYAAEEAKRVGAHEAALAEIEILASVDGRTAEEINERIWKVPSLDARPRQEFRTRAERVIALTLQRLQVAHAAAVQLEAEAAQAEAERLAEAERQRLAAVEAQRQREEQIAREAAEAATKAAEAAASAALEKSQREAREAQEKAQRLADEAELERKAAHSRALASIKGMIADACSPFNDSALIQHITKVFDGMSELKRDFEEFQAQADETIAEGRKKIADRLAVVLKNEEERRQKAEQEAAAKAQRDADAAIEAERQRVAAQQAAEQAEADKRARNVAHQRKVNRTALAAMIELGLVEDEQAGERIIKAIVAGQVPGISVNY